MPSGPSDVRGDVRIGRGLELPVAHLRGEFHVALVHQKARRHLKR